MDIKFILHKFIVWICTLWHIAILFLQVYWMWWRSVLLSLYKSAKSWKPSTIRDIILWPCGHWVQQTLEPFHLSFAGKLLPSGVRSAIGVTLKIINVKLIFNFYCSYSRYWGEKGEGETSFSPKLPRFPLYICMLCAVCHFAEPEMTTFSSKQFHVKNLRI